MTTPQPTPAAPTADQKADRTVLYLFIGLMITMLLASLNQTVLSTALPTIVGELKGVDQMTWVITGYILATTIVMPIYGRISDLFGRKPVLIAAISLFIVGSIIGGLAQNIEVLIASRVLQGLGGGGLMILAQATIADVVPPRERGRYMGAMGAVFAVSSVAGPLLGGWLTEGPGWRWAFWINIPLGLIAIAATIVFLPKRATKPEKNPVIDYLGMALIAGATTALVLVCTWGGSQYAWGSWQIIGLIIVTVVLAALFVAAELRATNPVIPMDLFKHRNFVLTTIAALGIGVAMFGALGYMPTYIQMVTGVDATVAGLLMIPMMGGLLVASIVVGNIVSRTGVYKPYPIAGTLVIAVGLVLLSQLKVESPTWEICAALLVIGTGIGMAMQLLTLIVQNTFPGAIVGTATASVNYFRQVGATLGSAVVGSVFASRLIDLLHQKLPNMGDSDRGHMTPAAINDLPEAVRQPIIHAYNEALLPIFLYLVPVVLIAFVALCFVVPEALATEVDNGEDPDEEIVDGHREEIVEIDDAVDATTAARSGEAPSATHS